MGDADLSGKSYENVAREIADGYLFVSPIFLKRYNADVLKKLLAAVNRIMLLVRNEKFPTGNTDAIRLRNLRLSRLNNAATVIKYFAKERRWLV